MCSSDLVYFSFQLLCCSSLFFISSRSLLNISCIFSIHASIVFPRLWIIFTIITLNYFSGRLPISSSFIWFCRFLPCSFICDICFCSVIFFFFFYEWDCVPVLLVVGPRFTTLEFAGCWVKLGLGAEMRTSMRPHSND